MAQWYSSARYRLQKPVITSMSSLRHTEFLFYPGSDGRIKRSLGSAVLPHCVI
jgi:hypothetical protein